MRLCLLDLKGRIAINIRRWNKRLKLNVITDEAKVDGIIVIGNGTPDDVAICLISYHLNGRRIIFGVVKPPKTRISVLEYLKYYIKFADKILIVIDQEDDNIADIFEKIEDKLNSMGFKVKKSRNSEENRLMIYECEFGKREVMIVIVVNGLDEIETNKHTIEDHFIKGAKIFGIKVGKFSNSKDAWKRLKDDEKVKVYKGLKENRKIIEDVFPQHFKAFKEFET